MVLSRSRDRRRDRPAGCRRCSETVSWPAFLRRLPPPRPVRGPISLAGISAECLMRIASARRYRHKLNPALQVPQHRSFVAVGYANARIRPSPSTTSYFSSLGRWSFAPILNNYRCLFNLPHPSQAQGEHDHGYIRASHHAPFQASFPLRFHRLNTLSEREQGENSINISSSGIYFTTNLPLSVGEAVEVLLKMPKRITGTHGIERCFTGSVTHIESTKLPEGYSGVGVQFLCYIDAHK
jgi:hypothetical protein